MFGFILKYGCEMFPRFEGDRNVRVYFKHEYPILKKVYTQTDLDGYRRHKRTRKYVYEVSPFFVRRVLGTFRSVRVFAKQRSWVCGSFTWWSELVVDDMKRDPKLSCNYCDLKFNKRRRLDEHMNRTHEKC